MLRLGKVEAVDYLVVDVCDVGVVDDVVPEVVLHNASQDVCPQERVHGVSCACNTYAQVRTVFVCRDIRMPTPTSTNRM